MFTETLTAEQKACANLIPNPQPPTKSLKGKMEFNTSVGSFP